ncbi:MAG: hypothetical protein PVF56_02120 [Desulfobacterales bacterium]|jgi:hypothetical protein
MDTNEITCPKCGHINNYISEGCVKCGIIFSKYYEMQQREGNFTTADADNEPNIGNDTQIAMSVETSETVEPQPTPDGDKAQAIAETPGIEPQESSTLEVTSEIDPAPPSSEISMEEIEMPLEDIIEPPESDKPIAFESSQADIKEPDIEQSPEKSAEVVSSTDDVPEKSDTQTADQSPVHEKAEQLTPETAGEAGSEPKMAETDSSTEEVLDLLDPVESEKDTQPETDAQPEAEPQPESIQPKVEPESVSLANTESVKADDASPQSEEKNEVEILGKGSPMETEEEILLESLAEPVKAEATPAKSEDDARVELLKKQKAALAKAEALKKEKASQAKAVALKKQKLAQTKLEALKKQKAAQAKLEALKKKKAELAKAEAIKKKRAQAKAEALKQQKEAQIEAQASSQQQIGSQSAGPKIKIMGLLKKYEGKTIGINYDNSAEIREAELVEANDEFFSVMVTDTKLQYSYPLQTLLSLIEGEDGVETGEAQSKTKYDAVIKVYPLVLF